MVSLCIVCIDSVYGIFFTSGMFLDNICIVISTARNVTKLLRPEPIDAQNGSQI